MSLYEQLQALASVLEQRLPAAKKSEANTSQFLVMPFFDALGYSVHNPNDVEPEYTADLFAGGKRVDYALKKAGKPILLIEVKPASGKLERQHTQQLHAYFSSKLDVRFGVVTNGLEYRFYSDLELPNVMDDEPFLTLDMRNLDESLIADIQLFTKSGFDRDRAVQAARVAKDRGRIRSVLRTEFDPLSQEAIQFILNIVQPGETDKSRRSHLRALINQEWREFVRSQQRDTKKVVVVKPGDRDAEPSPSHKTETKVDPEYIPIYAEYDGHRFKAELRLESVRRGIYIQSKAVRYNGELMTASHATWLAITSVKGEYHQADWARDKMNSWEFWKVVDPLDKSERELRLVAGWKKNRDEALYERVLAQK